MAFSQSRNEHLYLQAESTFGVIPNSSGTATVSGSNACRFMQFSLTPKVEVLMRADKTGTRSRTAGISGRRSASWSCTMDLAANGSAGVVPDCDPILQATFGGAGSISADAVKSFSGWSFRTPSSMMQRVAAGAIVKEATFKLGENIATAEFSGDCLWIPDSVNFSALDTAGKCGLSAFPSEPGSPVTNGLPTVGFLGAATFDGNTMANIRSATLKIGTGNDINRDVFGSYYGDAAEGDTRAISLEFSIFDSDVTGSTNLYQKALTKSAINVTLQIGNVAGNTWTFTVKGVQLETPAISDGQRRWVANFGASMASASSITATDEVGLVIT
jgi:hypothetical protein